MKNNYKKIKGIGFKLMIFCNIFKYNTASSIAKVCDLSFSSVSVNIKKLYELGLIKKNKIGRNSYLSYTERGIKLYTHLDSINTILNENERND